jgi:autophagy-related protein 18
MNGKGAVKRIQVENMKSLVDINLVGKNNQSFIAYSGLDKFLKGKVNIIPIGQWDTEYEIEAHKSYIDFIRLSPDGKFLATASEKGTLIRIYELSLEERDTITNDPIFKIHKEFRRGLASKHIKDINFGHGNQFITVSSNSEKIHLFWLKDGENVKSKFKALGFINSYLGSEWSKI